MKLSLWLKFSVWIVLFTLMVYFLYKFFRKKKRFLDELVGIYRDCSVLTVEITSRSKLDHHCKPESTGRTLRPDSMGLLNSACPRSHIQNLDPKPTVLRVNVWYIEHWTDIQRYYYLTPINPWSCGTVHLLPEVYNYANTVISTNSHTENNYLFTSD